MDKDPRQHLDTFFGVRNNIRGTPKEGVNYTLETLTYMSSHNRADQITQMIIDRMISDKIKNKGFGVFECCAGIGGNTLSFLENPNIQWVVSYEIKPDRREMLRNNITMYNLAKGNNLAKGKSFVPDEPFTGVPAKYKGAVLYFDPPWLPEHIKGHESTKDQYLLHGIVVGGKTLEQWVIESPHVAMVVARVPPGYKLDHIPGYNIDSVLIKNSLMLFITPSITSSGITPTITSSVTTSQVIKPITTPSQTGTSGESGQWYEGLKNYIKELLIMVAPSEQLRDQLVSDENMKIWVNCFTDESYNPNVGYNYEEYEMIGDRTMEYTFTMYLYLNIPKLTKADLTILKSHYMSKVYQSQVSVKLGLPKWIRTNVASNMTTYEDLLEAFFGGLNIVGNNTFKFGAGVGLCYNLMVQIFKDVKIERGVSKKEPVTIIKETFEQIGWGTAIEDTQEIQNNIMASISLTPEAMRDLKSLGVNLQSPKISQEYGTTKKVALKNAYRVALENLRKIGITEEWVSRAKGNRDFNNPELQAYIQPVQTKIISEGYESFYLSRVKAVKTGKLYQLIGVKPDGFKVILAQNTEPKDETEGKKEVLVRYLQNQ